MNDSVAKYVLKTIEKSLRKFQKEHIFKAGTFQIEEVIYQNREVFRSELQHFLESNEMIPIQYISTEQKDLTGNQETWKSIFLTAFNKTNSAIKDAFTKSLSILTEQDEIVTSFFSCLEPGAYLPPHKGKYNGLLRLQLALVVNNDKLSYLDIGGDRVHLQENEIVVFDDTFLHSAGNQSNSNRIVLIVDFLRPLPTFYHYLNVLGVLMIGSSKYVKQAFENLKKF